MTRPAAADGERLEIVQTQERLSQIESAWQALWQRVDGLIFQSHGWIAAWWSTIPDRDLRSLRIGLIWEGETLRAVMPLATCRRKGLGFLEWAAAGITDYGDFLIDYDCPQAALQRLWTLVSVQRGFDLVLLGRLLPDSAARRFFDNSSPTGIPIRPDHRRESSYRVVGDWASGDAWFGLQSKKTRKGYRHAYNTLKEDGDVCFRLLPPDTPLRPVMERIAHLKRRWLDEGGRTSDLFDEQARSLSALVDVLARAGILRIFVLERNGLIIAISVNFVQRGVMMAFVTTYDPAFARASPGMLLMMDYIRWSLDQSLTTIDFLAGDEPFKQRFATRAVTLRSMLGIRTVKGSLAAMADGVRRSIRERRSRGENATETSADIADVKDIVMLDASRD